MRLLCSLPLLLVPFLLGAAPPAPAAARAPEPPPLLRGVHRIVTLGDSITQAGGQPGGYVTLLQEYLSTLYPSQGIEVVNAGISGHKSTDMQARFQRDVVDRKPDLVTISVGVNDVWHAFRDFQNRVDHPKGDLPNGVPLPLFREKVTQMIQAAKSANIRVVLLSPTIIYENLSSPENARLDEYVAAMRDLGREQGVAFVDMNAPFKEILRVYQKHAGKAFNLLTIDGVHMNAAGNRVMTYTILRGFGIPDRDIANLKVP